MFQNLGGDNRLSIEGVLGMWERFKQWPLAINNRWVIGAIATPALVGLVGGLSLMPDRNLQPEDSVSSPDESETLDRPNQEALFSDVGAIAMVIGGIILLLNARNANEKANATDLRDANLSGADFSGIDLGGANLNGAELSGADLSDANLNGADLSGANLNGADLSGAELSRADLSGADLIRANLNGADLNGAELRYTNLSDADLRYANLSGADLRYANLSGADLNCALLSDANLSDANLSGALLFFVNSREVLNLEPFQLEAEPSPFLCNVALPAYSHQPDVNPNRDCDRIPQLLSARYDISLEEAQGIVEEARQHRWD